MGNSLSPMPNPDCRFPRFAPRFCVDERTIAHRIGCEASNSRIISLVLFALLMTGTSILRAHDHPAPKPTQSASPSANAPSGSDPSAVSMHGQPGAAEHVHGESNDAMPAEAHSAEMPAAGHSMEHMSHDDMAGMEGMDMGGATAGHEHAAHAGGGHAHSGATPSSRLVLVLLLVTLAVASGLLLFARRSLQRNSQNGLVLGGNLLDRPIVGKILRSRLSLTFLIVPTMAIFSFIVITGLLGEQNTSNPAVLLILSLLIFLRIGR